MKQYPLVRKSLNYWTTRHTSNWFKSTYFNSVQQISSVIQCNNQFNWLSLNETFKSNHHIVLILIWDIFQNCMRTNRVAVRTETQKKKISQEMPLLEQWHSVNGRTLSYAGLASVTLLTPKSWLFWRSPSYQAHFKQCLMANSGDGGLVFKDQFLFSFLEHSLRKILE